MADISSKGITLKVRLYKYPNSSTARLLGLGSGGSGALGKFIATYRKDVARFIAPPPSNPVVLVYDNDDGANSIRSAMRQMSKHLTKTGEPFDRIVKNLYAVATPLLNGAQTSKIEDFFPDAVKAIKVEGKSFHDGNSVETDKHYGKKIFAHRVVQAKPDSIDFTGFRPLLDNMRGAMRAHWKSAGLS